MKKILMLDDNTELLKVMKIMLRSEGYDFTGFSDCRDFLEKVKFEDPDIIIMDIMMPKMNGFMVCGELKSDNDLKNIPVILITGSLAEDAHDICEESGADACLDKPFDVEVLLSTVKDLLEKASS